MNGRLLKSKMILFGDEDYVSSLANLIEVSRQTASAKLKGDSDFTQTEISTIARHYNLNGDEIKEIFIEGDSTDDS